MFTVLQCIEKLQTILFTLLLLCRSIGITNSKKIYFKNLIKIYKRQTCSLVIVIHNEIF